MRITVFQDIIDTLRGKKYSDTKCILQAIQRLYKPVIVTRIACLGAEALQNIDLKKYAIVNHKKNRVDYILNIHKDPSKKAKASKLVKFIGKEAIRIQLEQMYHDEESDIFKYKNVKAIIIDSFAELTDQLFVSRTDNSSFCSHYSDIKHDKTFESLYVSKGLLDLKNLRDLYDEFFDKINLYYGNIPIIFLCFSTKFDDREKFKIREKQIFDAISNRNNVNVICLDNPQRRSNEEMAYHYDKATYEKCSERIIDILNKRGFCLKFKNS